MTLKYHISISTRVIIYVKPRLNFYIKIIYIFSINYSQWSNVRLSFTFLFRISNYIISPDYKNKIVQIIIFWLNLPLQKHGCMSCSQLAPEWQILQKTVDTFWLTDVVSTLEHASKRRALDAIALILDILLKFQSFLMKYHV